MFTVKNTFIVTPGFPVEWSEWDFKDSKYYSFTNVLFESFLILIFCISANRQACPRHALNRN